MDQSNGVPSAADLNKLKLPELRAIATQIRLKGISRMRKPELVEAIAGASQPKTPVNRAEGSAKKKAATSTKTTPKSDATNPDSGDRGDKAEQSAQPKTASRRRVRSVSKESTEPQVALIDLPEPKRTAEKVTSTGALIEQDDVRKDRRRVRSEKTTTPADSLDVRAAVAEDLDKARPRRASSIDTDEIPRKVSDKKLDLIDLPEGGEPGRSRNRRDRNSRRRGRDRSGNDRNAISNSHERNNVSVASSQVEESEPREREDDSLVPIAGILDIQPNHAFVRTSGYLPGDNDVYVTLGNVRRWGLRGGDAVVGAVRASREGERRQQKYNALVRVDSINGMTIEQSQERREFGKLTPEYPTQQLRLETTPKALMPRVIDLVAPVGKGQRGLIVAPPKAGKTMCIQQIAKAIEINNPEVHLMVVLVDERPEEVTDMREIVNGEVIASTFDRPAHDHTVVAELAIERAKRLVEMGQDVVVLLDSLTRLSRAYNLAAPASGRILSGGVDAAALYPPKKFFGAARNLREGGSLTIIASALVETGSKMDEVIFEEFKGTGNMELRLSRQLADRRIFPAIDVNSSGTRREEMLFKPEELRIMWKLRRVLGSLDQQSALELILGKLRETQNNAEFLMLVQKTTPSE